MSSFYHTPIRRRRLERNLISVVSPTDTRKGKGHNVRRREDGPLDETKTEVHYEQHRNVGDYRSCRVFRHLRHLGMLQVLGPPPSRVRDLKEAQARRKRRACAIIWRCRTQGSRRQN